MEGGQGGTVSRTGDGYGPFNSRADKSHLRTWPDLWLPMRHTCECHGNACQVLGTGSESWFHSSVIFYLS